jgi:ABC-type transporter Mla subunit MlaD
MAQKKHNELAAGIFVLFCIAMIMGVVLWLGASNYFVKNQGTAVFAAYAETGPLGIAPKAAVLIGDVKIGTVSLIEDRMVAPPAKFASEAERSSWPKNMKGKYVPRQQTLYHVTLTKADYPIYANGTAGVASQLMGGNNLKITFAGSSDAGLCNLKNPILLGDGLNQAMDNLAQEFDKNDPNSILSRFSHTIDNLSKASDDAVLILASIRTEVDPTKVTTAMGRIKATLANTETMTASLKSMSGLLDAYTKKEVKLILDNMTTITSDAKTYMKKDVGALLASVRKISTNVLEMSGNLNVSSQTVRELLTVNYDSFSEIVDNMVLVSANLQAAGAEIRRNPWRLLYKPDKAESDLVNLYDAARAFQEGAVQVDNAVNKLKRTKDMKSDDPEAVKRIQHVREELLKSVAKFRKVEDILWKEVSKHDKP